MNTNTIAHQAEVIVELKSEVSDLEARLLKCQSEGEKSENGRLKWYGLYKSQREASRRDKQDRAEFAKRYAVLEGKVLPRSRFGRWIYKKVLDIETITL